MKHCVASMRQLSFLYFRRQKVFSPKNYFCQHGFFTEKCSLPSVGKKLKLPVPGYSLCEVMADGVKGAADAPIASVTAQQSSVKPHSIFGFQSQLCHSQ